MRRHLPLLLLLGCSPTPAQKAPDNLQLPVFDASAVQIDAGPRPVTVTVLLSGAPEPGVLVAFQDSAGAVIGTATTDKKGTASKVLPAGSQVTVMLGSTATYLALYTYVDVEPGDALSVIDPATFLASVDVTITALPPNQPAGTGTHLGYVGSCPMYFDLPPATIWATSSCVGPGKVPVLVLAQSFSGPPSLGYTYSKNNPIDDPDAGLASVALSGNWSTTVGTWTIDASNVPASASGVWAAFGEVASDVTLAHALVPPATFETHPGYPDFVQSEISAVFPTANLSDLQLGAIATRAPAPALGGSITMDFAQLLPAITSATTDFTSDPPRPTTSWTPAGSLASADGSFVRFEWFQILDGGPQTYASWTFVAPPTATSVKAPALPPEASAWVPSATGGASSPTVATVDGLSGYAHLRNTPMRPLPNITTGTAPFIPPLPKDGTVRFTVYGPNPG